MDVGGNPQPPAVLFPIGRVEPGSGLDFVKNSLAHVRIRTSCRPDRSLVTILDTGTHIYTYKGKSVTLQAWSAPEFSIKLRFSDFMTTAQDGGKVVSLTHRPPLPPGNTPGTHFF